MVIAEIVVAPPRLVVGDKGCLLPLRLRGDQDRDRDQTVLFVVIEIDLQVQEFLVVDREALNST